VEDKVKILEEFLNENHVSWLETLYMGDDVPDLKPMQKAAMPCAPADAAPEILETARYISSHHGGKGCVRDVIEKLLRLHGLWDLESFVPSR
jgi:3-deoxy-D-manno-octulosonate 8-phosphate phosphatase (KDO 8-P phosphatase)